MPQSNDFWAESLPSTAPSLPTSSPPAPASLAKLVGIFLHCADDRFSYDFGKEVHDLRDTFLFRYGIVSAIALSLRLPANSAKDKFSNALASIIEKHDSVHTTIVVRHCGHAYNGTWALKNSAGEYDDNASEYEGGEIGDLVLEYELGEPDITKEPSDYKNLLNLSSFQSLLLNSEAMSSCPSTVASPQHSSTISRIYPTCRPTTESDSNWAMSIFWQHAMQDQDELVNRAYPMLRQCSLQRLWGIWGRHVI